MQGTALLNSFPGPALARAHPSRGGAAAASIFLPKEHGSWSLVLEPLLLGLLIAPSGAGAALAAAAFAGFLARRPLKASLTANSAPARQVARETVVMFSALVAAGLFEVIVSGGWAPLWPLALAAPLGGLFAWFDAQNDSRAAAAEVAGSAAFALVPAALATLAGWSAGPALALAALAFARSVPTILAVRTSLRRAKGEAVSFRLPVLAALGAALGLALLSRFGLVPGWALLPVGVLLARTLWFASPARPVWSARRIGLFEAALGLLYVGTLIAAYRAFLPVHT